MNRRLITYSPNAFGGLAEHIFYQCQAFVEEGWKVTLLAPDNFLAGKSLPSGIERRSLFREPKGNCVFWRKLRLGWVIIADQVLLAGWMLRQRPAAVLLSSYSEYLSPCWFWIQWVASRLVGSPILANLHDPIRDYQVGPRWWHALSVRLAYAPLSSVIVHGDTAARKLPVPRRLRVVTAPVGIYSIGEPTASADDIRAEWGIHANGYVFLAFGFVRDNKRIDLMLEAMKDHPVAFLAVIGETAREGGRDHAFYRKLAAEFGVADRAFFSDEFTADDRIGSLFHAADAILLAYDGTFHSQSGVLNLAAACRRPVLASSGKGPLEAAVREFHLGVFVEPDSCEGISDGIRRMMSDPPKPKWDEYAMSASWMKNAKTVIAEIDELRCG